MEDRRALYTALRLNWLKDPTLAVEDWQVKDYREMPYSVLFERLREAHIYLDRNAFLEAAQQYDTPEELSCALIDETLPPEEQDQVYLITFELWRRLVSDKPSLSIFCDELDYQISLYDEGENAHSEQLQDLLASLQVLLEEGTDQGASPLEAFTHIAQACAHDLEDFLLDFIANEMDEENFTYAGELLEMFSPYLPQTKWLELTKARYVAHSDIRKAHRMVSQLLEEDEGEEELDFYLNILAFLSSESDRPLFNKAVLKSVPQLSQEEDLLDLIALCLDYHQSLYHHLEARALQSLLEARPPRQGSCPLQSEDAALLAIINMHS